MIVVRIAEIGLRQDLPTRPTRAAVPGPGARPPGLPLDVLCGPPAPGRSPIRNGRTRPVRRPRWRGRRAPAAAHGRRHHERRAGGSAPVSYTHLTLTTNREG